MADDSGRHTMATVTSQDTPQSDGRPTGPPRPMLAVRQSAFAFDDVADRMWHRQLPAWTVSGGIHAVVMGAFLAFQFFGPMFFPGCFLAQRVASEIQIVETKLD